MSVQFGKCNFDGKPADPKDLAEARPVLAPYGPDGEGSICKDNFAVLYRAFHTTKESRREVQPHITASGTVLTWDGRLDNREELITALEGGTSASSTDVEIVAAAFEKWETHSFGKLIGDWALSIWNATKQSLLLARDFIGTRQLYYSVDNNRATWCTILDPLVLFATHPLRLEEEYIAGWLTFFPAAQLSPYKGTYCVPPSSFVHLTSGVKTSRQFWDFNPNKKTSYREDSEYERHFRTSFEESLRRRLRSDSPVLAELSGGMDSSSVVCVADDIIARNLAETPRLDTVTYYDESDPNWDERPYFSVVEAKRGSVGWHIDASAQGSFPSIEPACSFAASPSSYVALLDVNTSFGDCRKSQGNRVVLSGTGGDEVTGGIPTPIPELQDLLVQLRISTFLERLMAWALAKRQPWLYLIRDAVGQLLPHIHQELAPQAGLDAAFTRRYRAALSGYERILKLTGGLPSFQANRSALCTVRRQIGCEVLSSSPPYEKRFPFLDRDLLEFLYSVPREQMVRPGQRRSLMRRSLAGIVPSEILNRKRKAYVSRFTTSPVGQWITSIEKHEPLLTELFGVIDVKNFCAILRGIMRTREVPNVTVRRIFYLELWLRTLNRAGISIVIPSSALHISRARRSLSPGCELNGSAS